MGNFSKKEGKSDESRESTAKELFLKTLADVYFIKSSAVSSLGSIASRVVNTDCKLLVLQLGTAMNGQILRLKLITSLIANNGIILEPRSQPYDEIVNYLKASDQEGAMAKDAIILSRFLVVNSTEISSFKLLIKVAPVLKTKMVRHHLKICLTEATVEKTILETKLSTYI
ncbi:protein of unknown function [Mucilaginibacter gossypiicola]|uniref:Uncharacterized protein n=1 Tax=Mucilaginibacter gossypiicola TaxID=551995 RepID=A0A1H8BSZ1_9SPHI|nr:DUF892 family protein [Mucilaginibacter gossypiicola]SEM85872.1 protein of unknown function [Mucilaginibacter gossypiicola]